MATVNDIYAAIDKLAPFDTQMSFDRAGFLVGSGKASVKKALIALDITNSVIDEAVENGCQLIISHHPVIWNPLKRLMSDSVVYRLAENNLSVISAHTNLDAAQGGVCDCLAERIGLLNCHHAESVELGTVGELPQSMTAHELAELDKNALGVEAVQAVLGEKEIKRVGVIGGAGADFAPAFCAEEVDALVTGEAKLNELIDAYNAGATLIVAGHHETEVIVLPKLAEHLRAECPETEFIVSGEKAPAQTII